jgi:BASS family bile acid:Na+ symporter
MDASCWVSPTSLRSPPPVLLVLSLCPQSGLTQKLVKPIVIQPQLSYIPSADGNPTQVRPLQMSSGTETKSSGEVANVEKNKVFEAYTSVMNLATTLFPLWTVIASGVALKSPSSFAWFTTEYFTAALAALMLSMGITLSPADFAKCAKRPNAVFMQFSLCYAMMPVLALVLGKAFGLDSAMLAGMVLVGCINGGQASNLCTYIAKGNVAMSVLMTTATTLGAIFMTPILCKLILGKVVPVDAAGIAYSTIQVVLAPIAVGMSLNKFFPALVKLILPLSPVVGVVSTCLLVGSAVAQTAGPILAAGWSLQVSVLLLHLLGGLVGYFLPRLTGFGEVACRTMAIETAMKSSAFGFLLAKLHFGDYAARVPSAVSVVWMALTGSILAVIWRNIPVQPLETFDRSLLEKYPPFTFKGSFNKLTAIFGGSSDEKDEAAQAS